MLSSSRWLAFFIMSFLEGHDDDDEADVGGDDDDNNDDDDEAHIY